MPTPVFSDALEGMEIAIPPSSGNTEQETNEYGRSRQKFARRLLPPTPSPNVPPKSIARKPVASQRRESTPETSKPRQPCIQAEATFKPLPPEPLEVKYSAARRRQIASNQPTGHRSSQKISKWMGAEVNVFTEPRGISPAPSCSVGSSSSSVYSLDKQCNASRRDTSEIPAPIEDHRFIDAQTTHQYHRILGSTAGDSRPTSRYQHSCPSEETTRSEPRRLHQTQLDPRSRYIYELPRGQHSAPHASPGWEHPTSAFESDSDDNKVSSFWAEIRKRVGPKNDTSSAATKK